MLLNLETLVRKLEKKMALEDTTIIVSLGK